MPEQSRAHIRAAVKRILSKRASGDVLNYYYPYKCPVVSRYVDLRERFENTSFIKDEILDLDDAIETIFYVDGYTFLAFHGQEIVLN